jgi:uncharacterized membrane protein
MCRIGSLVCHQSPDRTILVANHFLPLCARCTGIYTGFLLSTAYQFTLWQNRARKLPVLQISLFSIVFLAVLIFESIGSYLGFWTSPRYIRLTLGLLGGSSIGLFLFPVFSFSVFRKRGEEVGMARYKEYTGLIIILGLADFIILSGKPAFYYPVAVGSVSGLLLLYLMLILTLISRINRNVYRNLSQRRNHAVKQ